jgi:hypothetical protein
VPVGYDLVESAKAWVSGRRTKPVNAPAGATGD